MEIEKKPGFWSNPIKDKSHAERICKRVAIIYFCISIVFVLVAISFDLLAPTQSTAILIFFAVSCIIAIALMVPSLLLWKKQNLAAAYVLLGLSTISGVEDVFHIVQLLINHASVGKLFEHVVFLIISWWFISISWRAVKAIKEFLRTSALSE